MNRLLRNGMFGLASLALAAGCLSQGTRVTALATAKEITSAADLIGGPNAGGQKGDFLLQNERIRVIVQAAGRSGRSPFSYGGNVIDLDRVRFPGEVGGDRFGGATLILNGSRTVKPSRVFVLEDGSATGYAIVRVEGDDAPYNGMTWGQFAAAVSRPVRAGFTPETPLDLLVKTDYILRPGANYLEVRTTFVNRLSAASKVVVGDMLDYGSTQPFVSAGQGFALPGFDQDYGVAASTVFFEATGVSYGYHLGRLQYIQSADNRSRAVFADLAVWTPIDGLLGNAVNFGAFAEAVNPEGDLEERMIKVPGAGSAAFSRYLSVGQGDAGELVEAVNAIHGRDSEFLGGTVTTKDTTGAVVPAVGADVAVLQGGLPIAHFKTDANGQYRGALLPGDYEVTVNMQGHPYANSAPTMTAISAGRKEGREHTLDMAVPAAARLRLFIKDMTAVFAEDGTFTLIEGPLPGHVAYRRQGGDPSPAAYDGAAGEVFPFRPAEANVVTVDPSGEASFDIEAGEYEFVGYHGPAFSMARSTAELRPGKRTDRVIEVARVVNAEGMLQADFSGQTLRTSGDVSVAERIVRSFAEGVELLVITDASARTDVAEATDLLDETFSPSGQDPRPVTRQIAVASGERVSTSGYGVFAAWPLYPSNTPTGGGIKWDGAEDAALTPTELIDVLLGVPADRDYIDSIGLEGTPTPFVAVDPSYAQPGSTTLGYFDAIDLTVDWSKPYEEGALIVGKRAATPEAVGLSGKAAADLLTDGWNGINVFSSTDEQAFWLGANSYFALLNLSAKPDKKNLPQVTALAGGHAGAVLATGGPRNLIPSPVTELRRLRCAVGESICAEAAQSMAAVNAELLARRNVVTNGPWLSLEVASKATPSKRAGIGEMVDLFPDNAITFDVAVTTPCWAPVDRIEIYMNAEVTEPTIVNNLLSGAPAPVSTFTTAAFTSREIINDRTGLVDATACRADGTGFGRIEVKLTGTMAVPRDSWLVAVARGSTAPPFGVPPLAMTNAVFVETQGDGKFGPVCPGADCPNAGTTRLGWYTPDRAESFR